MLPASLIRKLFRVALYSSPAIAAIIITPLSIMHGNEPGEYLLSVLTVTIGVFVMWAFNILIIYLLHKQWPPVKKRRSTKYLLSLLMCLSLAVIVSLFIFHPGEGAGAQVHEKFFHFHIILFLSINIIILVLEDLVLVKDRNAAIELENAKLKMMHMEAANEQLKQQLQPHFLFNSLSTLKALINTSSADAETYLLKLADFLRASISAHTQDKVKVADELKLCMDYLDMQQMRFGEALRFSIDIPATIRDSYYLPVFSIQLLIENAIKHNTMSNAQPLNISISCAGNTITVSNDMQPKMSGAYTPGTGLSNLQERYRLLYGEDIVIDADGDKFSVSIKCFPA